ncbi:MULTISPECIES: DUF4364 family protein [Peptoniphilus]|uniref:DUF4364 family protein n=1 Tax=Peptoniphilus TaxID=162289 RepID=UPI0001DAA41A|nr:MULTISPECIES: DUF4364 family protein [Peptoniphilus]EFI41320.1 hypothetical protein HMPREF0629_01378 [Peptoniphilus sp. oral taxon 386 str. F0131]
METLNISELAQNKLILLFIIKGADNLFTEEELTSFILEREILNFFLFKQYISELLESNFIIFDSKNNYHITEDGKNALELFIENIPVEIKDKIIPSIMLFKRNKTSEKSVLSSYYKDEFERFFVNLTLKESENDILNLTLEVPNEDYAKSICENFKNNPDDFYLNIINYFD